MYPVPLRRSLKKQRNELFARQAVGKARAQQGERTMRELNDAELKEVSGGAPPNSSGKVDGGKKVPALSNNPNDQGGAYTGSYKEGPGYHP
jgi:hypothetical protein